MDLSSLLNPEEPRLDEHRLERNGAKRSGQDAALQDTGNASATPFAIPASETHSSVANNVAGNVSVTSNMHELDDAPIGRESPVVEVKTQSPIPALDGAEDGRTVTDIKHSPTQDTATELDDATMQAINDAQNQFGTRVRRTDMSTREDSSEAVAKADLKPLSKKRPKSATSKTNNKKRPSKKPRLDSPTASHRSNTPSSNRKSSKTPAARSTPLDTHSSSSEEPESDPDDTNLYCICRKPDNHTWMIGCDGGCEDWFHGKCVGMVQADEPLLDKFICPNCEEKDVGVTTWKPMCRRDGCRNAARLKKGAESKYCSDDCGKRFMQAKVKETGKFPQAPTPSKKKRRTAHNNDDEDDAHVDLGPLGGPIRPYELAALANTAPSLDIFKALGNLPSSIGNEALPTPPASSISPCSERKNPLEQVDSTCTPEEVARLARIAQRKDELRARRVLLKDREHFVGLVKAHAASSLEKQQCGFDPRLSWDDTTFAIWRASEAGKAALSEGGSLGETGPGNVDAMDEDGKDTKDEVEVCLKKRCHRHGPWQKLALQDVRFEEADVGDEMRRIDGEERGIRERARARLVGIESVTSTHGAGGGWVEVAS